jgi:tryptophan halogenase
MNLPRIIIVGNGIEAWLMGALLRTLTQDGDAVMLVPAPPPSSAATAALPSEIDRAHRLLRIPNARVAAIGRPRFGIRVRRADGSEALLPYGDHGEPETPGGFAGQWLRLRQKGGAQPLDAYSVNAALMAGRMPGPTIDARLKQSIVAGWDVLAARYLGLLEEVGPRRLSPYVEAERADGAITALRLANGERLEADLYIDASEGRCTLLPPNGGGWRHNVMAIGSAAQRLEAPEPFGIAAVLSSAARLLKLLPRRGAMPVLAAEYRRLLAKEQEMMATAASALARIADPSAKPTEMMIRYEARYRACGLLPSDPGPWTDGMWLACFEATGITPGRYDPNIDYLDVEMSTARLSQWADLVAGIDA